MSLFSGEVAFGVMLESDFPVLLYDAQAGIVGQYSSSDAQPSCDQGIYDANALLKLKPDYNADLLCWDNHGGWMPFAHNARNGVFIRDPLSALAYYFTRPDDMTIESYRQPVTGREGYRIYPEIRVFTDDETDVAAMPHELESANWQLTSARRHMVELYALRAIRQQLQRENGTALVADTTRHGVPDRAAAVQRARLELSRFISKREGVGQELFQFQEQQARKNTEKKPDREGFVIVQPAPIGMYVLVNYGLDWYWVSAGENPLVIPSTLEEWPQNAAPQMLNGSNKFTVTNSESTTFPLLASSNDAESVILALELEGVAQVRPARRSGVAVYVHQTTKEPRA